MLRACRDCNRRDRRIFDDSGRFQHKKLSHDRLSCVCVCLSRHNDFDPKACADCGGCFPDGSASLCAAGRNEKSRKQKDVPQPDADGLRGDKLFKKQKKGRGHLCLSGAWRYPVYDGGNLSVFFSEGKFCETGIFYRRRVCDRIFAVRDRAERKRDERDTGGCTVKQRTDTGNHFHGRRKKGNGNQKLRRIF